MTNDSIVILAPEDDIHAAAVAWGLRHMGVPVELCTSLVAAPMLLTSILWPQDVSVPVNEVVKLPGVRSVWNRRPKWRDAPPQCHVDDRDFVAGEWSEYFDNLVGEVIPSLAFFVNDPRAAKRASLKAVQLHHARAVGLSIPDTLISNDSDQVRAFAQRHEGKIIGKPFYTHLWSTGDITQTTAVCPLSASDLLNDDSIRIAPTIYQPLIHKVSDVRVTVIGHRLFALRYHRVNATRHLELKVLDAPDVVSEAVVLPNAVEEKLRELMLRLGLVFGCIDLAIDNNGNYTFFEVNEAGQWLFCEYMDRSLPMLASFCSMLAEGRPDYANVEEEISWTQFERGPEYARFVATPRSVKPAASAVT
jgi:hypothetical protein